MNFCKGLHPCLHNLKKGDKASISGSPFFLNEEYSFVRYRQFLSYLYLPTFRIISGEYFFLPSIHKAIKIIKAK